MNSDLSVGLLGVYCMAFMGFKIMDCIVFNSLVMLYSIAHARAQSMWFEV